LIHADITVNGPSGSRVFHTDDDPNATHLSAHVLTGAYTADLADGWTVVRIEHGVATPVDATLISPDPAPFEVVANGTTNVPLRFRVDLDDVDFSEGDFDITVDIEEVHSRQHVGNYTPFPSNGSFSQ